MRTVLPSGRGLSLVLNPARRCADQLDIPDLHRVRVTSDERHRIELPRTHCRVQRLAVWRG